MNSAQLINRNVVFHLGGTVYPNWKIDRFPDGQLGFRMIPPEDITSNSLCLDIAIVNSEILDVFLQICHVADKIGLRSIRINYLYGARSDKDSDNDGTVKVNIPDMLDDMISARLARTTSVEVLLPHCQMWRDKSLIIIPDNIPKDYDLILYPDRSARGRFLFSTEEENELTLTTTDKLGHQYLICDKERDQLTGNIIKHVLPSTATISSFKKVLVVDDLCDGGRTFLNIAEIFDPSIQLDLFVTHGVFSNNAIDKLLNGSYNNVYTTNSYQDFIGREGLHVTNVWRA